MGKRRVEKKKAKNGNGKMMPTVAAEPAQLNLMLIERQDIVFNIWPKIAKGMLEVLTHSHGDATLAKIHQQLMSNPPELHLWVGFAEEEYAGFVTTRFMDVPQGRKFLDIMHVYAKPGIDKELFWQGLDEMERFAKKYGCNSMRFWTERAAGFARKLRETGWEPKYVEFVKEVGGHG